ncbi:MAG: phosphoribosylglycinamide formyltransferase [Pseudomonadota bacterium]
MSLPRVGILISGGGTNMLALVNAMQSGRIPAEPALVLSSEPGASGLAKAAALGVPTAAVDWRIAGQDRAAHDAAVGRALAEAKVDLVACAGYLRIMTEQFVTCWQGRMINIHPSILPAFRGLDTHARALASGCAVHGCTVHEVVPKLDAGHILGQAVVPVLGGDTPKSLAARVLRQEHKLYPAVLAAFARDAETARRTPISILAPEE